jgi:hypothetical protein
MIRARAEALRRLPLSDGARRSWRRDVSAAALRLRPGDAAAAIGALPYPSGGPPDDSPAGGAISPHPAGQQS